MLPLPPKAATPVLATTSLLVVKSTRHSRPERPLSTPPRYWRQIARDKTPFCVETATLAHYRIRFPAGTLRAGAPATVRSSRSGPERSSSGRWLCPAPPQHPEIGDEQVRVSQNSQASCFADDGHLDHKWRRFARVSRSCNRLVLGGAGRDAQRELHLADSDHRREDCRHVAFLPARPGISVPRQTVSVRPGRMTCPRASSRSPLATESRLTLSSTVRTRKSGSNKS